MRRSAISHPSDNEAIIVHQRPFYRFPRRVHRDAAIPEKEGYPAHAHFFFVLMRMQKAHYHVSFPRSRIRFSLRKEREQKPTEERRMYLLQIIIDM